MQGAVCAWNSAGNGCTECSKCIAAVQTSAILEASERYSAKGTACTGLALGISMCALDALLQCRCRVCVWASSQHVVSALGSFVEAALLQACAQVLNAMCSAYSINCKNVSFSCAAPPLCLVPSMGSPVHAVHDTGVCWDSMRMHVVYNVYID